MRSHGALADLVASDKIRTRIQTWTQKQSEFYNAVWYLQEVKKYAEGRPPSETKANYGVTEREQWNEVERIRVELRQELTEIGALVRGEL
jgi:hypothetical protein